MAARTPPQVEFSRPIKVDDLGEDETIEEIEATQAERKALARRFGVVSLDRLVARVSLRRLPRDGLIQLEGCLWATVTQACVVTLEAVTSEVEREFSQLFTLGLGSEPDGEVFVDLDAEDPPEPVEDGRIDLGEAVAEHLSLALDPYPRGEGAELQSGDWDGAEARNSPFAVLGTLKSKT